jgi:hypothetical protein
VKDSTNNTPTTPEGKYLHYITFLFWGHTMIL